MTVSLVIVIVVLGQIYLALLYFSRPPAYTSKIRKRSTWPRNLKYVIPLLTWIIYLNLFGRNYSLLTKYSKISIVILIILISILRYVKADKSRTID